MKKVRACYRQLSPSFKISCKKLKISFFIREKAFLDWIRRNLSRISFPSKVMNSTSIKTWLIKNICACTVWLGVTLAIVMRKKAKLKIWRTKNFRTEVTLSWRSTFRLMGQNTSILKQKGKNRGGKNSSRRLWDTVMFLNFTNSKRRLVRASSDWWRWQNTWKRGLRSLSNR